MSNNQPQRGDRSRLGGSGPRRVNWIYIALAIILVIYFAQTGSQATSNKIDELSTSDFVEAVEENRVDEVTYKVADGTVSGTYWKTKSDKKDKEDPVEFTSTYAGSDSLQELMSKHSDIEYNVDVSSDEMIETVLITVVPTLLLVGVFIYYMSQMQNQNGQAMSFGKAKARTNMEERPKTKFSDVAGIDEAVEELREVKDFLSNPGRYQRMGAKIPHGVLLVGPPGTGKTLLARAVAGEAGVPFFSISGSDFVEMFVGVGASRVRDLFRQAKEAAPSIIFIDEIDAVGRQRGAGLGGGHDEREQTLNQLLVEMDGFDENETVIMIAATNRPDILDPALLRPGRFDRQVTVDRPDVGGRQKILEVHSKGKPVSSEVDYATLAKLTPGFTGADLANLMNEAALLAARHDKREIGMPEIEEAMERVIAGPERKSRIITEKERTVIAYHESGHALVGHVLKNSDPVHKISIISRGQALGYTLQMPEEDHFLQTRGAMLDEIAGLLAGRTAEELACDDITTGASNDLERATKLAREMVTRYGMSEELGTQVFGEAEHQVFLGRDYANHQDYSPETAKAIDDEVHRIMHEAHDRATLVLTERRSQLDTMARVLLERETVEGEELDALLNDTWDEYAAAHPEPAEEPQSREQQKTAEHLSEIIEDAADGSIDEPHGLEDDGGVADEQADGRSEVPDAADGENPEGPAGDAAPDEGRPAPDADTTEES